MDFERSAPRVGAVLQPYWASVSGPGADGATTFLYTGAIVNFTVPTTGTYRILALGAQGGDVTHVGSGMATGGKGAEIGGDFPLTAGEVLQIGGGGADAFSGGGGGSFVIGPGSAKLVIAGGGGGQGEELAFNGIFYGGGGSFDRGLMPASYSGVRTGYGFVKITKIYYNAAAPVPEPAFLAMLDTGFAGFRGAAAASAEDLISSAACGDHRHEHQACRDQVPQAPDHSRAHRDYLVSVVDASTVEFDATAPGVPYGGAAGRLVRVRAAPTNKTTMAGLTLT